MFRHYFGEKLRWILLNGKYHLSQYLKKVVKTIVFFVF